MQIHNKHQKNLYVNSLNALENSALTHIRKELKTVDTMSDLSSRRRPYGQKRIVTNCLTR